MENEDSEDKILIREEIIEKKQDKEMEELFGAKVEDGAKNNSDGIP